ncbi:epithelial cell-transforming sequence 2 oncogene-like isoform X2 [Antennarius striatus]|uniref:epithelial cell-transforming sequence 2 oncogene-like isoform X2 n=1 Tax=Antennarius striatus TaxID=241820 RepID=UPI0035B439BF
MTSAPHSVKRWQLSGTDYDVTRSQTLFSTWTPLNHESSNRQLFQERMTLVLRWFDLWNGGQRKHFLRLLLTRCSGSQLRYCRDLLTETLPVTRVDFTAVLPRFLSLYVMSFLPPRDLCAAAQVSWHWRTLAEQDCLWSGRCVRRGWFLPYAPSQREVGAWKSHYVSCVSTLDWLTPREAAERYRWAPRPGAATGAQMGPPATSWSSSVEMTPPLSTPGGALASFTYRPPKPHAAARVHQPAPTLLLLLSNRVPAYELLLGGATAGATVVLYDHRGTQSALLAQARRALSGQRARRVGLLAPGGTEEIQLLHDRSLSETTLLTPDHKGFWETLAGWVEPAEEGGGIDLFSPLAASAPGVALIQTLSTLTGLEVRAPAGLATGSFQNILSEWSDGGVGGGLRNRPAAPALRFVREDVLQAWCRQARWMEGALEELRALLEPHLQRLRLQTRGRALGHFLWEGLHLEDLCVSADVGGALIDGLSALAQHDELQGRPLEFLANFLSRWPQKEGGDGRSLRQTPEPPQVASDWRGAVARELLHSEGVYVGMLTSVMKVYQEPLTAALTSSRAILGVADLHLIFTPVTRILELNKEFQADLRTRLLQWGGQQCVGDVVLKLCSNLRVYSSYLDNYTTALHAVDKCREAKPAFRAFLKRADRTLATHMLSLQELLLCPVWRIQEYVTLLQALSLHTPPAHPDHAHLASALDTLLRFKDFVQKLKRNSERERLMEETQQAIQGCPNLREGNRRLVTTQEAALLRSPDEEIPDSLRIYEHVSDVGLFLFNDALVLTRRNVHHTPFTLAHRSTHTFLASVALTSLVVREITHSRYVSHAFVLVGPRRSWVCSMDTEEEKDHFLSVLRSAIDFALTGGQ